MGCYTWPVNAASPVLTDDRRILTCRRSFALARGLSNKEIAAGFGVSVRTVENHVSHILARKGFSNRVEIARLILEDRSSD